MPTISLTFYALKFKKPGRSKKFAKLDHLEGKYKDVIEACKAFINSLPKYSDTSLNVSGKADLDNLFLEKITAPIGNRQISGVVRSGDTGYSSSLFDSNSGKKTYDRKHNDIELMPFYFMYDVPTSKETAIIALQGFGKHGIASRINSRLKDFLRDLYPAYTVQLSVIHIGELFIHKYIKDGKIRTIEGTEYFSPKDNASDGQKSIKCTRVYSPIKRGEVFGQELNVSLINHHKQNVSSTNEVVQTVKKLIAVDLPDFNEMKFKIDISGKLRTVDLDDLSKTATKFDITDNVSKMINGHPKYSSIEGITKDIVKNDVRKLVKN